MIKTITRFSFLLIFGSILISCTTADNKPAPVEDLAKPNPPVRPSPPQIKNDIPSHKFTSKLTLNPESIKAALQRHYNEWKGVNYKYGGLSKSGIDCSGFIYITFKNLFDINTPRSTKLLANSGTFINKSQLQPGDLVLYKTTATVRHVGIYYGDNKFLHASKSRGVMISDMKLDYWRSRYWQSRRVL